jgi:D-amino peptidase
MDVLISADIEGVAGVVSWDQTRETGFEYETARVWMTREVIAAAEGARSAGARRIVIADSHGNGQNLKLDLLPPDVEVVRGWPRPLGMMQGVETLDRPVVFCLGYHTGAAEIGQLNHTIHGGAFWNVRLDGESVSELEIFAAVAGAHGGRIGLVTGDAATEALAARVVPHACTVAVKTATGRISAQTLMPDAACARIKAAAGAALAKAEGLPLVQRRGPIRLGIDFKWHHPAETLALLPGFERTGTHSVATDLPDMLAVAAALEAITQFRLIP